MKILPKLLLTGILVIGCTTNSVLARTTCGATGTGGTGGYVYTCNCTYSEERISQITGGVYCGSSNSRLPCIISKTSTSAKLCYPGGDGPCGICGCSDQKYVCADSWAGNCVNQTPWTCTAKYTLTEGTTTNDTCATVTGSGGLLYKCGCDSYSANGQAYFTQAEWNSYATSHSGATPCTECPQFTDWAGTSNRGSTYGFTGITNISGCTIPDAWKINCADSAGKYVVSGCSGTSGDGDSCK